MNTIYHHKLPYQTNSAKVFERFAQLPYAFFLDSCRTPSASRGRFDIIVANPIQVIKSSIDDSGSLPSEPFSAVKQALDTLWQQYQLTPTHLPFQIGALGYFSYDIGRTLEKFPNKTIDDISLPLAVIGIYDWSIVVDHQEHETWLITGFSNEDEKFKQIQAQLEKPIPALTDFKITQPFHTTISKQAYADAFIQLKQHIYQGDCYQANLCQRFSAQYQGSEWLAYQQLRQHNPTPFAAYLNFPEGTILSLSPERFLQVRDKKVETKPIKGTSARFEDSEKDQLSAQQLLNSKKDQAENLMIVDLLRNDLGKVCKPGSIKVPKLFALESYPNVHHLVSTIVGELNNENEGINLLQHCFPGGSVTGTPKIRAMEIIEDLETYRRSVYCGSIGYFDISGSMDTNIAIRTIICDNQKMHCYAGGAIVYDSELESEYQEACIKVNKLFDILEAKR